MGFIFSILSKTLVSLTNLTSGSDSECWQLFLDEPECPKSIIER